MRRTKFYDGFHEGIHNEIRERSQLETKFAAKNRPEKPLKSTKIPPKLELGGDLRTYWDAMGDQIK